MPSDTAQIVINQSAAQVFSFLSDPARLDMWSVGTWKTTIAEDGLVEGKSIHTGQTNFVRIQAHPDQGLIDYLVGPSPEALQPRIFARVIPGPNFAANTEQSMLLLVALRTQGMDDQRWEGLKAAHAFEVGLIKSLIESGYDHRKEKF